MHAVSEGNTDMAKLLIDHGAKVDKQDKIGNSVLMYASLMGSSKMSQLVLDHGAEVNT